MGKITGDQLLKERKDMARTAVSLQIRNGTIKNFTDIFAGRRFPKSHLVEDLGIGAPRISKLIKDPGHLELYDCVTLGNYFDVPPATIALLGFKQTPDKTKKPR